MRVLLTLALLLVPTLAHAQAFKCVEGGKTTYQDAPCADAPSRAVDTSPSSSGVTGLKSDAARMAAKERAQAVQGQKLAAEKLAAKERKRERIRQNLEIVNRMQQSEQQRPPSYSCRPSAGGMNCDPW